MRIEKTQVINVDGVTHAVSTLPLDIRQKIEILDEMRQKQADLMIDLQMASIAVDVMTVNIQKMVKMITNKEQGEDVT